MEKRNILLNSSQKTECTSDSSEFREVSAPRPSLNQQTELNTKKDRKVVIESPQIIDDFQFQPMDDGQYEPDGNTLSNYSNLKKELEKYKKIIKDQQIAAIAQNTKVREIKLRLDETTSKNKQLETEIQALKIDNKNSIRSPSDKKNASNDNLESTISTFEELLKTNCDQLTSLFEARKNLVELCGKYQQCFDKAESLYQDSQDILSNLHKSILHLIPPELQGELQKFQDQKNKQSSGEVPNKKETANSDNENIKQQEESNQILQIVSALIEDRCYYSTASHYYSATNSQSTSGITNCDDQILGHLENALYFIRTLSKSDYKENPIEDIELKELIENQCQQIETFLQKNEPTKVASIFGDNGSIGDQLKTFYNIANRNNQNTKKSRTSTKNSFGIDGNSNFEEDEEENANDDELFDLSTLQPEVRSLFSLFTAAIEVNKILSDRNKVLEREYKKYRKGNKEMKYQKEQMKSELQSTGMAISDLKSKMERNLGHEITDIDSGLDEFCEILSKTSDVIDIKDSETEKLKRSVLKLKKTNTSLSNQLKAKEKQISSLVKKLNEARYEKESAQKELNDTIERTKREKENEQYAVAVKPREIQPKEDESELDFDKQDEVRMSLTQQLQDSQEQNKMLQTQLAKITKEMDNYQASSDLNTSTMSNYESHITGLKGKMKKLRQQKAKLESQLQSELEDVKKRNEQLDNSYARQVSNLNKELETVRSRYIEQKELTKDTQYKLEESYKNLAKAKVIQKKLETELKDARENFKLIQQQNELKIKALKMSYEKVNNDIKQKLSEITKKLKNAVNCESTIANNDFSIDDLADLVDLISEKYDFGLLKDAALCREKLNIGRRMPLSYAIDEIRLRIAELEKKLSNRDRERNELQKKYDKKVKDFKVLTDSYSYKESSEWKRWAEKLYCTLNANDVCPINIEETKDAIERAIEGIRRPASFDRKMNILKTEKKILNNPDIKALVDLKYTLPLKSIRPIILTILFVRKIEIYAPDTDSQTDDSLYLYESEENVNE